MLTTVRARPFDRIRSSLGRWCLALAFVSVALFVTRPADAHCFDGQRDGTETDVDCGGACAPCEYGDACIEWRDCLTGRCGAGTCEERPYEGGPVPPNYQVVMSTHDAAATARDLGFLSFGLGYAVAYVAALSVPAENAVLFVPVYGPWKMSARKGQENPGILVVDAIVQTVGFILVVGGFASAGKQLIRTDQPTLRVAPTRVGESGYGFGLTTPF